MDKNLEDGGPEVEIPEDSNVQLIEKIESAYKIYKVSEMFLKDVSDDYGKEKIARLRLEFARHELMLLLDEARDKGINMNGNEMLRNFFYT